MWVAPIRSGLGDQKKNDFDSAMGDWYNFVAETETNYGVNMNVLTKAYREEHARYFLKVLIQFSFYYREYIYNLLISVFCFILITYCTCING